MCLRIVFDRVERRYFGEIVCKQPLHYRSQHVWGVCLTCSTSNGTTVGYPSGPFFGISASKFNNDDDNVVDRRRRPNLGVAGLMCFRRVLTVVILQTSTAHLMQHTVRCGDIAPFAQE